MIGASPTAKPALQVREDSVPVPMQGELQEQFFDRAMRALRKQTPSINRRTVEVLNIWRCSLNDQDLRDKAYLQFPEDKFTHYGPRCVFLEHTVPASADGSREEIVYDRTALQHLVDWGNYRIKNSDNFAAISNGHTPTAVEKSQGHEMPEVLGYAGPFYLGLLGDVDPVWAIYADEWVHNDDIQAFEKLQRRSPEVWVNEPIEKRTMDPIAALGAETPRLDSGMNPYCRLANGRDVYREVAQSEDIMRYSAAAFPGPANAYIPDSERGRKSNSRYGASAMPNPENEPNEPDIGGAVARALEAVMPSIVQAVQDELMGGSDDQPEEPMNPAQPGETAPVPLPEDEPTNAATSPRGMPGQDASADEEPVAQPQPETPEPKAGPGDDEEKRYKAMGADIYGAYCAGRRSAMKTSMNYSRDGGVDKAIYQRLAAQDVEIRKLRAERENERQDAMRYAKLVELSREFDFDPKDEMETVIEMSQQQFDRHCTVTVQRYARRDDITNLQIFDDPTVEVDQYGRGSSREEPTVQECERYHRMAAEICARKWPGQAKEHYDAEYDALVWKDYPKLKQA